MKFRVIPSRNSGNAFEDMKPIKEIVMWHGELFRVEQQAKG